jgi:hypothetical protein
VQGGIRKALPDQVKAFSQGNRSWGWTVSVGCSLLWAWSWSVSTVEAEPARRKVQSVLGRRSLMGDPGLFEERDPMELTRVAGAKRDTRIKGSPQFGPDCSRFLKAANEAVRRVLALQSRLVFDQRAGVLDCELEQVHILSVHGADSPGEGVQLHILPDTDKPRLSDILSVSWVKLELSSFEVIVCSVPSSFGLGLGNDEDRTGGMRRAGDLRRGLLEQSTGPQQPKMHHSCGGVWSLEDGRLFAV